MFLNCERGLLKFNFVAVCVSLFLGLGACTKLTVGDRPERDLSSDYAEEDGNSGVGNSPEGDTQVASSGQGATSDGAGEPFQGVPPIYSFRKPGYSCDNFSDVAVASLKQRTTTEYEWSNSPCSSATESVSASSVRRVKFDNRVIGYRKNPFELQTIGMPQNEYVEAWCLSEGATDERGVSVLIRRLAADQFNASIALAVPGQSTVVVEPFSVSRSGGSGNTFKFTGSAENFSLQVDFSTSSLEGALKASIGGTSWTPDVSCFVMQPLRRANDNK